MPDRNDRLKLQIGDPEKGIAVDGFIAFFQNAVAALKELDKELSEHGLETIQWEVVEAGSSSPVFATFQGRPLPSVSPNGHSTEEIITTFSAGLEKLNRGNRAPTGFSRPVLHYTKQMALVAKRYGLKPTLSTASTRVIMEDEVAENADWAMKADELKKKFYTEHGSLEGVMTQLSTSDLRGRDRLVIVNRVTGEHVTCYFHSSELEQKAREAWKRRVVVTGRIRVNSKSRRPEKIKVDQIRILPRPGELPGLADLQEIDITGGLESSEYVRRLRDVE
jgi:hypothetical protein